MKRLAMASLILFATVLLLPACQKVEESYDSVTAQIHADQCFNNGEYEQAIKLYEKAISIDSDGILYYKLAKAYEKVGNEKMAVENLKKAEQKARFLHQEVTKKITEIDPEAEVKMLNEAKEGIEQEKEQAERSVEEKKENEKVENQ